MFTLTTNELYNKDLILFLTDNIDDGYGKPFSSFTKEDQNEVIADFTKSAPEKALDCCYQSISRKYVKAGTSDYFQLEPEHFSVNITNNFYNQEIVVKELINILTQ